MTPRNRFSIARLRRGVALLRRRGLAGNVHWFAAIIPYRLWLHFSPAGRRELYFDTVNRVNTGKDDEVRPDIDVSGDRCDEIKPHEPTMPWRFLTAMRQVVQVDYSKFVFIDIGCGKGRALLLAEQFPFKRVIGVELSPALVDIARTNLAQYGSQSEVICAEAGSYDLPREPLVLYLYNPFVGSLFDSFIFRVEESIRLVPRPVYIVYNYPVCEARLSASPSFTRLASSRELFPRLAREYELFAVYAHLNG